jgi:hypothetical protein
MFTLSSFVAEEEPMETLFAASSLLVLPFWLLMLVAPRWRWTERLVRSPYVVAGPVALYAALVVPDLLALLPAVARPELPSIAALLGTPRGATIAWAHFLALDLFAGRWIYLDARARGLPAWTLRPLLLLTLLFGPLGLGAYFVVQAFGPSIAGFARQVWAASRPLALLTLGSLALLGVSLALQLVDPRVVTGAPAWAKPAKFGASVALTAPVLAWIMGQLDRAAWRRRLRLIGGIFTATLTLELVIITAQAARGVRSHFNASTPLDVALFGVMGSAITIFWLAQVWLLAMSLRHQLATPARTWAVRLGLAVALLGGAIGFVMPRPTPDQLAALNAGQHPGEIGAHTIGARDGGPGLPVTRWSTEAGDLRAPHFFGLHALQALPLLAWALERRRRPSARPIAAAAVAWLGLTAVTLVQALRAQPLLAPDALTLASAAVALAAGLLVLVARRYRTAARFQPLTARAGVVP